jgi:3-phenylpropionate/trans-cinnamate dioxygenase ferredoxin subunit
MVDVVAPDSINAVAIEGEFAVLATLEEFAGRPYIVREHCGASVLLAMIGDICHVIENRCPHQNVALAGGRLSGEIITCPEHGAKIDMTTGICRMPHNLRPVRTFAARVIDGKIEVATTATTSSC